jgi:zinc protease
VAQKESLAKIEKTFSQAWALSRSSRINSANNSSNNSSNNSANEPIGKIKNHQEHQIGAGKGRVRPMLSRLSEGTTAVVSGPYNQTRIEMAFLGPNVSSEDSIYLDMASHILGGHDLSRLQLKLRDELGLVTSISSSTYAASFGGLFEVSITAEINNLKSAVEETCKVIGRFMTDKGPDESEIARTRISFESSKVHQLETVNGIARNILSSLQTEIGLGFDTFYDELVSKTTAADIQKSSRRYLNPLSLSLVLIKGDQDKFDIDSLLSSAKKTLTEAQKPPNSKALKNLGASKKDSSRTKSSTEEISELEFGGSNRLIYRRAKSAKSMSLIAMKIAGLRRETSNSRGIHAAVASLLAQETNHTKYEKFLGAIDDLGMSLHGFSGKDSFGLEVYAIMSQWQKSLGLFIEAFAESKFSTKRLGLYVDEVLSDIKNSMDSVSHVCMRRLSSQVFGDHPYAHPLVGTPTSLQVLNAKGLTSRFDAMKASGEWLFVGSGPAEPSEVAKTLRALKQGPRKKETKPLFETESRVSDQEKSNDPILNKKLELDAKEQVHIALGWRGLTWKDKDRYALDVLSSLLGGHGGRLFMRIREELGLAYSVGTICNHGVDPGLFGVYMATSKNNQAQAMDELKLSLSIERLSSISDQEIELTKSHIAGNYQIGQQRLSAQCMTMGLMELYGVGLDELRQYPLKIHKVKKTDVLRVATRLLSLAPEEVSC